MERIMSKTNTSKLDTLDDQLNDRRTLADSELDAVTGGAVCWCKTVTDYSEPTSGGTTTTTDPVAVWNKLLNQYGF
jgi:hypothetical protein